MPCRSDHMNPTAAETYSRATAKHICYVNEALGKKTKQWVLAAAQHIYGNVARHDELTALLCGKIRAMSKAEQDKIIYDGRNPEARQLAAWWDEHQAVDARREAQEAKEVEAARKARMAEAAPELVVLIRDMLSDFPLLEQTEGGKKMAALLKQVDPEAEAV